jgi:hypothetical protein
MSYRQRDEEYALVFWKEVLQEFYQFVACKLSVKQSEVVKAFIIHDRKPTGLPNIMVSSLITSEIT